jgi:DNA-binding transcriptional ArsR family regulator
LFIEKSGGFFFMAEKKNSNNNLKQSKEIKKILEEVKEKASVSKITAKDLLEKSEEELKEKVALSKRETHNNLKDLKIILAVLLGKDKNKELSQVLDTDKSFTSKQIKELEEKGLIKKEGEGKNTRYTVDKFNVMKFLTTRVVIKWKEK